MNLINNIDTIRIPLYANKNIYYFPENNNLIGKTINNIYVIEGKITNLSTGRIIRNSVKDPYNDLTILEPNQAYLTLYDIDNNIIVNNIELSYFVKNKATIIDINSKINWKNSYINIFDNEIEGKEIVLFCTYDGVITEDVEYNTIKTITIPGNYNGNFEDFIYSDTWGKLIGIDILNKGLEVPMWVSIKDRNGKNFDLSISDLFQYKYFSFRGNRWITTQQIINPLRLNYLSPIWKESTIINKSNQSVNIILYFIK